MATLFTNGAGFVLAGGEDGVASTCCCGTSEPINACDGVDCGGDPSMQVTVTGASGTITWVGETWNLPADSGVTKCVCPTAYALITPPFGNPIGEDWQNNATTVNNLRLLRNVSGNFNPAYPLSTRTRFQSIRLVDGAINVQDKFLSTSFGFTSTTFQVGVLSTGYPALGSINDFRLTDGFFSSYTTGGITYTWAKGNDW